MPDVVNLWRKNYIKKIREYGDDPDRVMRYLVAAHVHDLKHKIQIISLLTQPQQPCL